MSLGLPNKSPIAGWSGIARLVAVAIMLWAGARCDGEDLSLMSEAIFKATNLVPDADSVMEHGDPVRYSPCGNGNIVIGDPKEDPILPIFMNENPNAIMNVGRPNLFNQEVDDEWDFYNLINTDRPDFTDATYSVGKGVTIIENGYTYHAAVDKVSGQSISQRTLPETLYRYGITDEFEVRLKYIGYTMNDYANLNTGSRAQQFGADDLYLGVKYEMWQQKVWRPMMTFVGGSYIPTGTQGLSANQMQPFVNFVAGWGIRRWLYLKMSTGVDWQHGVNTALMDSMGAPMLISTRNNSDLYHFSTSLLYQATKRVGGFIEWYNLSQVGYTDDRPSNYVDTGFYIYATTSVQFDIRYGRRLSDRIDESFEGAGLSVRY